MNLKVRNSNDCTVAITQSFKTYMYKLKKDFNEGCLNL